MTSKKNHTDWYRRMVLGGIIHLTTDKGKPRCGRNSVYTEQPMTTDVSKVSCKKCMILINNEKLRELNGKNNIH
jgi:hypothetical protein